MTAIYNKVKRMAALAFASAMLVPAVQAQEALHFFFKDGNREKVEITSDTKIEFVKQPYVEVATYGDTIQTSASAGRTIDFGWVRSNVPWTVSVDANWLTVRCNKRADQRYPLGGGMVEDPILIFTEANATGQERIATVTIKATRGNASKQITVVQHPYVLSLEPIGSSWGFEGVTTKTATIAWSDTLYAASVYPNFDVKVLSCPEWMTIETVRHGADGFSLDKVAAVPDSIGVTHEAIDNMDTYVRFRMAQNLTSNARTGDIVFEAHGQKATIHITQEGLNDTSILNDLEDMQLWMVRSSIASTSHDDFSHMSVLHATDMMTEDMTMFNWHWFGFDYEHDNNAPTYRRNIVNWETYYGIVTRTNSIIDLMADVKDYVTNDNFILGNAYAYRAMAYLYLIQLFQDPTTEYGVSKSLPGVPMLYAKTEQASMSSEQIEYFKGRNTVGEVMAQIEADITRAIELLQGEVRPSKNYIDITVAQGIAARYYLLAQEWNKAATMANAARNTYRLMDGNTENNGIRDGFMDIANEEWMWGFDHTPETTGWYASFFAHISNLADGYSGIGYTGRGVDARLLSLMSATDYRRAYWYRDENGNTESTAAASPNAYMWQNPYAILKFGWKEDWTQDYIYMRAAEMILIEAEAYARLGQNSDAANALSELMQRRDPEWQIHALDLEEIYLQRRLELIGEGHAYFDLKRLNRGIERNYEGSNHLEGYKINVAANDSAWVYKIPQSAINNDQAYNLTEKDNLFTQNPVYLNEVSYSSYNNDTIFMSASAGRTYSYGWVQCNYPWKVTADADWLMTKVNEDTIYNSSFTSGLPYENIFMVYATANETDQERVGHVTISTEQNVSKTFTVVQRPYTLSFYESAYINNIRYDGEPVDTFVINGTWDWRNIYYNLLPNHGWEVTSYPDWMTMDEFAHGAENCSFDAIRDTKNFFDAGQPVVSTASFTFEPNESLEPRTAHIIFEGHGQKAVGIFHQEGLNEQAILNGAEALAKKMYQFGEAVGTNHHNDFGFPSLMLTMDGRGTDLVSDNSNYNWFTNSLNYSDLGSNLVYTAMYWTSMYNQIQAANEVIRAYGDRSEQSLFQFYLGQAHAFRAFNYFYLAQLYQQTYVGNEDQPCVPIISESNMETVYTEGCARATVHEVYDFILSDLDKSLEMLQQTMLARPGKQFVSSEVIYGLRARINMVRGEWQAAAADAQRVIESGIASPYTLDEVSKPSFNDINHEAWLWGIDATENDSPVLSGVCNWPSHMGSFNTNSYAEIGTWRKVSQSLYNAIPSTDVRKGWFLDANAKSANLNAEQADYVVAKRMPAYTQVKFAPYAGLEGTVHAQDIPLMRIEEMHLILAEAKAMMGDVAGGATALNSFVSGYRDAAYNCTAATTEELVEAVWMQRRIELWGEGHSYFDLMRLKKGVDRRGAGFQPDYVYNIPAGDAALIYPIPDREMSRNFNLIQNPVAEQPKSVTAIELEDAFEHYCYGTLAVGLFKEQWEQAMEVYQLDGNIYRLPDYIVEGYDLVFHWDQTTNEAMFLKNSWETGYMHPTYGMITANGRSIVYDEATKTFTFAVEYTVSAGSFGEYNDTFTLPGGGEEPSSALYMIGQDFGAWDWTSDGVVTMTPVNSHEGAFWTTRYFTAGNGFKFCQKREWNGDFFSLGNDSGYTMSGGNCVVEKDGFYTVYVDLNNSIIAVEPAAIYGIGECFGGWDVHNAENLFAAQEQTLVSPSFVLDGEIRMYAAAPSAINEYYSVEWWQMEFNIYDGVIVYRGADGDQERVLGYLGQQVTLDLNAGTGTVANAADSSTKISDVLAAGEDTEATIQGTILATYARGFLVADDTGSILIYLGSGHGYVAGDIVSVSGTVKLYGGLLQFPNTSIVEKMGHTEISHSEPTIMDAAAMDAYLTAPGIQYAQYTGTLNISGSYYNVNIEGATTAVGSISYPNEGLVDANFNGKAVTVTGYLIGASSNKYVNTMAVNVTLAEGSEENPGPENPEESDTTVLANNLINNGGFEEWTEKGAPTEWKSTTTAGNATLVQSSDAYSGNYAVQIEGNASSNKRLGHKEITLKAGTYNVHFYAKAATAEGGSVRPGYTPVTDGKVGTYAYGNYVNDLTVATWVEVNYEFTLNAETTVNLVVMCSKNPGKSVLIDEYSLTTEDGGLVGEGNDSEGEEGSEGSDTPGVTYSGRYISVTDFSEEEIYLFVAGDKVMSRLDEAKTYGYMPAETVKIENGEIASDAITEVAKLTVTSVEGGYTLQDTFGRYIFMKGDYNSFNISTDAQESYIWNITSNGDNTFSVTNPDKGKTIMYDTQYSSYGCYPSKTDARQYVSIYKYVSK